MALRPDELKPVGHFTFACIARLKPGVSLPQAVADLGAVQSNLATSLPGPKIDLRVAIVPLRDQIAARARSGLEVLLAAVGAVLLILSEEPDMLLARHELLESRRGEAK